MTILKRKPGTHSVADTWENRKVARVVALHLAGRSTVQIADELRDGTSPQTIGTMLSKWAVKAKGEPFCKVPMSIKTRAHLGWRAERRGLTAEEYLRQVVEAVVANDLFDAVTGHEQQRLGNFRSSIRHTSGVYRAPL